MTVFGPLMGAVKGMVSSYVNNPANVLSKFTVYTACELLVVAHKESVLTSNTEARFQRTGLWPLSLGVLSDATFSISQL